LGSSYDLVQDPYPWEYDMARNISLIFSQRHKLVITKEVCIQLQQLCIEFEIKKQHPNALNTNLLGVYPMYFLAEDYNALFNTLGINQNEFIETRDRIPSSSLNKKFNVASDPYNLLTLWAVHCILNTRDIPDKIIHDTVLALFKLLLYKFFTSLVSNYLRYGADAAAMQATMRGLSNKYDIVVYGTWKNDLTARATDIFKVGGLHLDTLKKFDDDAKILYILSDTQTRIRNKLKAILNEYYKAKKMGNMAKTYNLVSEIDGEKIVKHMANSFSSLVENTFTQTMSQTAFIHIAGIRLISEMFTNIRQDMFKRLLIKFSETTAMQAQINQLDATYTDKKTKTEYYIGLHLLTKELIQKTYRYAILNNIPIGNKLDFLFRMKDIFSSSRLNDEGILMVKRSTYLFVKETGLTSRDATISSLTIGLILYIIIRSFDFINK
jgi:hypothetical protein